MPPAPTRPLRSDAVRNRDKLLAAAREEFAESGLHASLEAIARRAGVSVGTLYHHFTDRAGLIDAALLPVVERSMAHARAALDDPDPWNALVSHLVAIADWQSRDHGFTDVCVLSLDDDLPIERAKREGHGYFEALIARAQASGDVRADVTPSDVGLLVWSIVQSTAAIRAERPTAWKRHLAIMLDGLRAGAAHPLAEPPLDPAQLAEAMAFPGARPGPR
ncbi:TetR/AcrR family transcriptional regulator [Agromyces intestinalis]|uniref:TetR/AcrR family transcriptional regulator n=2 Tax=Agromyces intestinalis TaxID=2592652 RepID=A0A5C1YML4_9MICO|nr:TetR/AcrR family transcriptional regulator [Agromyces intestinalis]